MSLSPPEAAEFVKDIVAHIGMRIAKVRGNPIVYDCTNRGNEGVTVAVVIETSHCVLHTWTHEAHDLTLYQFDLYSCAHFDPLFVCRLLKERFDFVSFEHLLIDRTVGLMGHLPEKAVA